MQTTTAETAAMPTNNINSTILNPKQSRAQSMEPKQIPGAQLQSNGIA
jgi:hypothetical protein